CVSEPTEPGPADARWLSSMGMRSSETRSVYQCTYTPVVNDSRVGHSIEGFVPRKPWLKLALLGTVLDRRLHSALSKDVRTTDPRLPKAADLLLRGDTRGAA